MRTTVFLATALAGAMLGFAAFAATSNPPATKEGAAKKATKKSGAQSHSTVHQATHKGVGKKGKKGSAHAAPAQARQSTPTAERYKEIQQALASKGYLPSQEANGQWGDNSQAALKRFQTDQNLEATGKINSLSLIALGLGPKHEAPKPTAVAPAAPPAPQQP